MPPPPARNRGGRSDEGRAADPWRRSTYRSANRTVPHRSARTARFGREMPSAVTDLYRAFRLGSTRPCEGHLQSTPGTDGGQEWVSPPPGRTGGSAAVPWANRGCDASRPNRRRHTAHESPPLRPAPRSEPPKRGADTAAEPDPLAAVVDHRRAPRRRPVLLQLRADEHVEGGPELLAVPEGGRQRHRPERRVRSDEREDHRHVQDRSGWE